MMTRIWRTGAVGLGLVLGAAWVSAQSQTATTPNLALSNVLNSDSTVSLKVRIVGEDGAALSIGGGTQYAEDTVHSSGDTGNLVLAVRNDAGTALAADGDRSVLQVDSSGALRVTGGGGGTQYTEDAAAAADPVGNALNLVRADSLAGVTSANGDNVAARGTDKGELYVKHADTLSVNTLQWGSTNVVTGGTNGTVGVGGIQAADAAISGNNPLLVGGFGSTTVPTAMSANGDLTRVWLTLNGGVNTTMRTITGDAVTDDTLDAVKVVNATDGAATSYLTVRLSNGTDFLTASQDVTEDAAETAGGTGPMVLSVRRGTAASSAGADGDNATFNTDALGKLWITGAFPEDAAHTTADTGLVLLTRRIDSPATSAGTTGDYATFDADENGAAYVTPIATNAGGASNLKYSADQTAANDDDEHAVCTGPCNLYSITATNHTATGVFLRCENDSAANTTPGSETPELDLEIPGDASGRGFTMTFPVGAFFSTAATCWMATEEADTGTTDVGAADVKLFYTFKQ